jgi:hypothetical protein
MRTIALLASILVATSFVLSLKAEEIIKDKSPDGNFALQLIQGNDGWDAAIVELPTKKKLTEPEAARDVKLVWSKDSRRVAYFNPHRTGMLPGTMRIYFRSGLKFEEVALPEIPRCSEFTLNTGQAISAKDVDTEFLETVYLDPEPTYWVNPETLAAVVRGEWKTVKDEMIGCDQNVRITFDTNGKAAIDKVEKPPEPIGRKIESPNGTFFVEELDAPAKDDEGHPRMDQEVWIVSAKDPAMRERLPGFYEEEGNGVLNSVTISPDENWIVISQHHGSHLNSTYLMRRKEGLKFEDAFPDAKWPAQEYPVNRFDNAVWKFFSQTENVPTKKIDANELGPTSVSVLEWSEDSGRLLLDLHGGLTGDNDIADQGRYKKPGISGWFAYYNTKTGKFELTERLHKANAGARKRWTTASEGSEGFLPPSAESIGHKGDGAPVAERLEKYEAALAEIEKQRRSRLDEVDRAEFEKNESEWREALEKAVAKIKDKPTQLGLRARLTSDHVNGLRESWWPVYKEAKSGDAKQSQP